MNALKPAVPGTASLATDAGQYQMAFSNQADVGSLQLVAPQSTPAAPNVVASGVGGNLNGTYAGWIVVLITGWQQSDGSFYVNGFVPSVGSATATITNNSASLTNIPVGGAGTIGRAIYRPAAGGAITTAKFVGVIWDNVTISFTDNLSDANLGTTVPTNASVPAVYGTAIPAAVPTANTTGTSLVSTSLSAWGLPGATAPTRYAGGTVSGPPTSGTFLVGDFVIDQSGAICICTVSGAPGTWKKPYPKVEYIPLWNNDATAVSTSSSASAGSVFLAIGNGGSSTAVGATKLHTLDSWSAATVFAFEALVYVSNVSAIGYAALWDFSANGGAGATVAGTTIQTSLTLSGAVLVRSSQVNLTAGHVYGVTFWTSGGSYGVFVTHANIVAFPS